MPIHGDVDEQDEREQYLCDEAKCYDAADIGCSEARCRAHCESLCEPDCVGKWKRANPEEKPS